MARSTTITLTPTETAALYSMVIHEMENPPATWSKGGHRVARTVLAKVTAALIETQREVGS